jgi:hypothetical protein
VIDEKAGRFQRKCRKPTRISAENHFSGSAGNGSIIRAPDVISEGKDALLRADLGRVRQRLQLSGET